MTHINELQSKVFDFLRFPLIVGVIFIHAYGIGGGPELVEAQQQTSLFYICSQLFSQIIGRLSVPLFFLMSGYLFFYNTDFDKCTHCCPVKVPDDYYKV